MKLPYFFQADLSLKNNQIVLTEETSKHCIRVLRMQENEQLQLTNGLGDFLTVEIINAHKQTCVVRVIDKKNLPKSEKKIAIAISLLKNANRFEWFLEKATELGITEIIPIISKRTEKQNFKFERMNAIVIAAMLQSQQCYLPILHEPIIFEKFINKDSSETKLIAHCLEDEKQFIKNFKTNDIVILIGPEGDFTNEEIELALKNNYKPVTLGNTRLRTETAGVVAATLFTQN